MLNKIWEIQGNKNGKLTKILAMKKLAMRIWSTPNHKACGPDGISMEFFKALIPGKDDSEEYRENNSNITFGFKCFKALINSIWNGDFLLNHGIMHW